MHDINTRETSNVDAAKKRANKSKKEKIKTTRPGPLTARVAWVAWVAWVGAVGGSTTHLAVVTTPSKALADLHWEAKGEENLNLRQKGTL